MIREIQVISPKMNDTKSNRKNPISPQFTHPIIAKVKRVLSIHFMLFPPAFFHSMDNSQTYYA